MIQASTTHGRTTTALCDRDDGLVVAIKPATGAIALTGFTIAPRSELMMNDAKVSTGTATDRPSTAQQNAYRACGRR